MWQRGHRLHGDDPFTTSDSAATLPADYTFTAADKGAHTFANTLVPGLSLKTPGSQAADIAAAFTVLSSSLSGDALTKHLGAADRTRRPSPTIATEIGVGAGTLAAAGFALGFTSDVFSQELQHPLHPINMEHALCSGAMGGASGFLTKDLDAMGIKDPTEKGFAWDVLSTIYGNQVCSGG